MSKNAGNIVLEAKNVVYYYKANKGKKVLVTGHTGFKGAWLCRILLGLGAEVTGYALEPPTDRFWQVWILRRMGEFIMKG